MNFDMNPLTTTVVNAIKELAATGQEFTAWNLTNKLKGQLGTWDHRFSRQIMDAVFNDKNLATNWLGNVTVTRTLRNVNGGGPEAFHYQIVENKPAENKTDDCIGPCYVEKLQEIIDSVNHGLQIGIFEGEQADHAVHFRSLLCTALAYADVYVMPRDEQEEQEEEEAADESENAHYWRFTF